MDDRMPWYRSLSTPSQVLLLVFLGLCLYFGIGLFRQLREYMANRVVYQQSLERLEVLRERRNTLRGITQDLDWYREELAREGMAVQPGDVLIQVEPITPEEEGERSALPAEQVPVWQQWRGLFVDQN